VLALLIVAFLAINVPAPAVPIGVAGLITVNGEPIEDNITVYITNVDENISTTAKTENGYYANAVSANDGDIIRVNFTYKGKNYEKTTIVDTSKLTHWVNFSITVETEPVPPCVVFPEVIYGNVGEKVIFNASDCYDPDGYIVSYEWMIFDYPPIVLNGKVVSYIWNKPISCNGLLKITDNDGLTNTSTFRVVIEENTPPPPPSDNETNETHIPPVANFTVEGELTVGKTVYLNSTSYDEDGNIVYHEWNISGKIYYGSNITVVFNESGNYTITLFVRDNDGLNASITKNITINEEVKKYRIVITANKPVNLKIIANETVYEGNGTVFDVMLPEGSYTIYWNYEGKTGSETIELNKDMEYSIEIKEKSKKKIPGFEFVALTLAVVIVYIRRFLGYKDL